MVGKVYKGIKVTREAAWEVARGGSSKKIIFSTFFGKKNKISYKLQGWSGVLP